MDPGTIRFHPGRRKDGIQMTKFEATLEFLKFIAVIGAIVALTLTDHCACQSP
jgi:hypothetical protein